MVCKISHSLFHYGRKEVMHLMHYIHLLRLMCLACQKMQISWQCMHDTLQYSQEISSWLVESRRRNHMTVNEEYTLDRIKT